MKSESDHTSNDIYSISNNTNSFLRSNLIFSDNNINNNNNYDNY